MILTHLLIFAVFTVIATARKNGNYSVQLMKGLAPTGWSVQAWEQVVDDMIGKTQAHILSDLIEDLGIELQVTEEHIRHQIDTDRANLALQPLPAHQEKPGPIDFLKKYQPKVEVPQEDFLTYLPPGWTEEKYNTHSTDDSKDLSPDVLDKLAKRRMQELEADLANPNNGCLETLPESFIKSIATKIHENARKMLGLDSGVRVYKKDVAPLVQVVEIQGFENWGFVMYRGSFDNDTAWNSFLETIDEINNIHLASDWRGTLMEQIEEKHFWIIVDDPEELDGFADGAAGCVQHFLQMKADGALPSGLEMPVILMADESSIASLLDPRLDTAVFIWAVDVTYDESSPSFQLKNFPPGYNGTFKVHPAAILHDLYTAMGSGFVEPVEIWELLQPKANHSVTENLEMESHDEL